MKKLLSILLATLMIVASFSFVSFAEGEEEVDPNLITPDKSWYSATGTTFEISTAAQFLGIGELLTDGVDFDNQTIKLTANIDVNPGWSAEDYMKNYTDGDDFTVAINPSNVWAVKRIDKGQKNTTIPSGGTVEDVSIFFKGTLDGQNHYVAGLFASQTSHDNSFFGFGGKDADDVTTFKDIAFLNSVLVKGGGSRGACVLGLGGTKTIFSNVYVDIDALVGRAQALTDTTAFAGICGWTGNGKASTASNYYGAVEAEIVMTDCVYAGTMYSTAAYTEADNKGGLGQSGIFTTIDSDKHSAKFEDVLSIGTHDTIGQVHNFASKSKGSITMNACVAAATVVNNSYKVDAFMQDQRVSGSFLGTGLVYRKATTEYGQYDYIDFEVTDEVKVDDPSTPENDIKVWTSGRVSATEMTDDEIKTINTVAAGKQVAGYSDWTSVVNGYAMPISTALATTVNAYIAPETPDDGNATPPAGDEGEDAGDETTAPETTETEAPETTKAAKDTEPAAEKKGCGGVIGTGAIAVVAVTGAALAIGKKKKED